MKTTTKIILEIDDEEAKALENLEDGIRNYCGKTDYCTNCAFHSNRTDDWCVRNEFFDRLSTILKYPDENGNNV